MNANDFLRAVAAVLPGRPAASRASALAQMASRLKADFADQQLTPAVADRVGQELDTFPTYHELADLVRRHAEEAPQGQQPSSEAAAWHAQWTRFVMEATTSDQRTHRLSMAKLYASPETWGVLFRTYHGHIEAHAPQWLPTPPDEIARRRLNPPSVKHLMAAYPHPKGATVATRPAAPAGWQPKPMSPEAVALMRQNNPLLSKAGA